MAFSLICVTHRKLCRGDFIERIRALSYSGIDRIILREKDLSEQAYQALAQKALDAGGEKIILHQFPAVCTALHAPRLHLSLPLLAHNPSVRQQVALLGVSVHAPEEAQQAQALGADYVTAGHVFDTDCKRGLPGRGLDFLRATCQAVQIPVYAIGGITPAHIQAIQQAGAAGACLMSSLMQAEEPAQSVAQLRAKIDRSTQ